MTFEDAFRDELEKIALGRIGKTLGAGVIGLSSLIPGCSGKPCSKPPLSEEAAVQQSREFGREMEEANKKLQQVAENIKVPETKMKR